MPRKVRGARYRERCQQRRECPIGCLELKPSADVTKGGIDAAKAVARASDRSRLDTYAAGEKDAAPSNEEQASSQGQATQSTDDATSDAKARGLVVLDEP